jgi:hypothetical protein
MDELLDKDVIIFEISRKQVEDNDISEVLDFLDILSNDLEKSIAVMNKCYLLVSGYDDDSRELYEIKEVVDVIRKLDEQFPYWFFYLNNEPKYKGLHLLMCCLCRYTKDANGGIYIDTEDLQKFLLKHFISMNELFKKFNLPQILNDQISTRITSYIKQPYE